MRFLRAADEVLPIHLEFVLHHRLQLEKANKKDFKKIYKSLFSLPRAKEMQPEQPEKCWCDTEGNAFLLLLLLAA